MQRGDRAPDFELLDETGHPRRLSENAPRRSGRAFLLPSRDDQRMHR